jgi:lambda repressor-like predicted transcriptional regulator
MQPTLDRHERIKMRLRVAGSSLANVARQLGVAPTTVTTVSQGYRRSRRIEAAIAHELQTSAKELWPERYNRPIVSNGTEENSINP